VFFALHTMSEELSFLYCNLNGSDGWFVITHNDFAEMVHVDVQNMKSFYRRYEAPIEDIRRAISKMQSKGYKLATSLDVGWKRFVEV
jgi:hypothetical protein